jgi:hypothetical protein
MKRNEDCLIELAICSFNNIAVTVITGINKNQANVLSGERTKKEMHFAYAVENKLHLPKLYKRLSISVLLILLLIVIGLLVLPYLSNPNNQINELPTPTPTLTPTQGPTPTPSPTSSTTPTPKPCPTPTPHPKCRSTGINSLQTFSWARFNWWFFFTSPVNSKNYFPFIFSGAVLMTNY